LETYEVEMKLRLPDIPAAEHMLLEQGAESLNSETQTDVYFDHPCRSFSETDEAVRVRSRVIASGQGHADKHPLVELTYKGPKIDSKTKTRVEYSVGVLKADEMTRILLSTGFREVATVVKRRKFFRIDDVTLSLDDVTEVGCFVEFESVVSGRDEMIRARDRIISLSRELGFNPEESIRESYLELYLKMRG
jgi:adenylate cyclase class 2